MKFIVRNIFFVDLFSLLVRISLSEEFRKERGGVEDICMLELFQPRCLVNEVILLRSATYGRMRIGRCVKSEEVAAHKAIVGDDPRYLGCSADVLAILDKKCSGMAECDIRLSDIPDDKIQPCFPGLKMYLEISFECISSLLVVDEERSCVVIASKSPTNILVTDGAQPICGTKYQPWSIEAPLGLRIFVSLIDLTVSNSAQNSEGSKPSYRNDGVIVDKAGNRNVSIYVGAQQREKEICISTGNGVNIFIDFSYQQAATGSNRRFILTVRAIGCSDIIPPEDAWLKRTNDVIVIGCYSSRQTWHLKCKEGSWVGVLGNCTHEVLERKPVSEPEHKAALSDKGQVIAIVGIGGFTLAICLTIVCVGAICLRKFYASTKKQRDYMTLNCNFNSVRSQRIPSRVLGDYATSDNNHMQATHSVFSSELNGIVGPTNDSTSDPSSKV